ncbi:MAG: hypothetical protein ACI8YP_000385 [Algoriphagus sp.]|jgi:hypothetical protein
MIGLRRVFFPHIFLVKNEKIENKISNLIKIETIGFNLIIKGLKYFAKAFQY